MSQTNPTCTSGCTSKAPVFSFSDCDPDVNHGQIDRIYIMALGGSSFANYAALAEWAARLDNTDIASLDKIRYLNVIGEKPEAAGDEKEISRKRKIIMDKTHTINFDIDETSRTNNDALRQIECGGNFKIWYQAGKYLWGGNDGIEAFVKLNDMIPRDRKELELFKGIATWENQFSPESCVNPML
jgi:hypothetical protein